MFIRVVNEHYMQHNACTVYFIINYYLSMLRLFVKIRLYVSRCFGDESCWYIFAFYSS